MRIRSSLNVVLESTCFHGCLINVNENFPHENVHIFSDAKHFIVSFKFIDNSDAGVIISTVFIRCFFFVEEKNPSVMSELIHHGILNIDLDMTMAPHNEIHGQSS